MVFFKNADIIIKWINIKFQNKCSTLSSYRISESIEYNGQESQDSAI